MTVQGILPTGPSAVGQVPSRGKAKTEGSQADPAFASLLAALVAPGTTPLPGLLPLAEGSEGQAVPAPAPADPTAVSLTPGSLTAGSLTAAAASLPVAVPAGAQGAVAEAPESGVPLQAPTAAPPLLAAAPALPATPGPAPASGRQPQPGAAAADPAAPGSPLLAALEGAQPEPPEAPAAKPGGAAVNPLPLQPKALTHGEGAGASGAGAGQHRQDHASPFQPEAAPVLESGPAEPPLPEAIAPSAPHSGATAAAGDAEPPPSLEALRTGRHDPGQVMEAISRAVTTAKDGQYAVTLRLYPEQLGEVRLQLHLSGREVHTIMEVATPEARQALESRGDQLRQSLTEAGLTLAGFEVATGRDRQSARERREALEEQLRSQTAGAGRRIQPVTIGSAEAVGRMRNAVRHTGRLDTMA